MQATKMLGKAIIIFVLLGTASSEPIRRSIIIPNDLITSVLSDYVDRFQSSVGVETMKSMKTLMNSAVGLKLSALEIGVKMMQWIISNLVGIAIGAVIAIGLCKITGKCDLGYKHVFSKLYSFVSADQLEMAQSLFISALSKYGQEDNLEEEEKQQNEDEKGDAK